MEAPLAVGVPERRPLAALNVTPPGKVPDRDSVGAGEPVAVTVNEPAVPTVNVALFALVIAAGCGVTLPVTYVQVRISWVAVKPPVPPVNPT